MRSALGGGDDRPRSSNWTISPASSIATSFRSTAAPKTSCRWSRLPISTVRSTGKCSSATATTWPRSSRRRKGSAVQGQAASDHRQHRARQGRLVYGGRLYVARKAAQCRASRRSVARARRRARKDSRRMANGVAMADATAERCISSTIATARSNSSHAQRFRRRVDRGRNARSRTCSASAPTSPSRRAWKASRKPIRSSTSRSASPSRCSWRWPADSRRSGRFRGSRATRCSIPGARGSKCARSWRSTKPT